MKAPETLSGVNFENAALVRKFVQGAMASSLDLADFLIALHARKNGADVVLTFDRKASRSPLFEAIP